MNKELIKALQVTLLQHGITPTVANPINVSIVTEKKDVDLQLTLPLIDERELFRLRDIDVSELDLIPINMNALIRNGLTTVGTILDCVESGGCRSLFRIKGLGENGFQILRKKLWKLGLVLDDKWKLGNLRDARCWYRHFNV